MTSYLTKKNRTVRFQRLREKAFETLIPWLEIIKSLGVGVALTTVLGVCIILFFLGLADMAGHPPIR